MGGMFFYHFPFFWGGPPPLLIPIWLLPGDALPLGASVLSTADTRDGDEVRVFLSWILLFSFESKVVFWNWQWVSLSCFVFFFSDRDAVQFSSISYSIQFSSISVESRTQFNSVQSRFRVEFFTYILVTDFFEDVGFSFFHWTTPKINQISLLGGCQTRNPEEADPPGRTTPKIQREEEDPPGRTTPKIDQLWILGVVLPGGSSSSGFWVWNPSNKKKSPVGEVSVDETVPRESYAIIWRCHLCHKLQRGVW